MPISKECITIKLDNSQKYVLRYHNRKQFCQTYIIACLVRFFTLYSSQLYKFEMRNLVLCKQCQQKCIHNIRYTSKLVE